MGLFSRTGKGLKTGYVDENCPAEIFLWRERVSGARVLGSGGFAGVGFFKPLPLEQADTPELSRSLQTILNSV